MIDSHLLRQIADVQATVDRLAPDLSWVQESAERAARFAREVEAMAARYTSPFEQLVLQDRTWTYLQHLADEHNQLLAGMERHRKAHMLISAALPKRGWYLSGQEPCTLSLRLARSVQDGEWDQVDQEVMHHLPDFKLDALRQWLAQEGVPDYCINRMCRFVKHHQEGNYEEATYLGVPLIDEIAKHLYDGKAFTTKRASRRGSDQSKPELAFKTTGGPDLASYCQDFVQAFGSLQEDPDQKSLGNENYWNRHAIVHGLMQRAMGVKDSAKCLMAINFLFFARQEKETGDDAAGGDPQQPNEAGQEPDST
jgi:hypothetical protein